MKMDKQESNLDLFIKDIENALKKGDSGALRTSLSFRLSNEFVFASMMDNGEIYHYNGGCYVPGAENLISKRCSQLMDAASAKDRLNSHLVHEVIEEIRRDCLTERELFDANPQLISCKNYVLNVVSGETFSHGPEHKLFIQIPVYYDAHATCPLFEKFLSETVPPAHISTAWEIIGYCLYRSMPIQRAIMLLGSGKNGKSVFLAVLRSLLGKENCKAILLQSFEANRFSLSGLSGALANIAPDLPGEALKGTGNFKALLGGDLIFSEQKFKNGFEFVNTCKLLFSANQLPATPDESNAYFRRWLILDFPNTFEGDADDKNLLAKLTTEGELSGILNKALVALRELLKKGEFSGAQGTDELRERYLRMSDSTASFFMDCLEVSPEDEVIKSFLFPAYLRYCKQEHVPAASEKTFFKGLFERANVYETQKKLPEGRVRVIRGIRLIVIDCSEPIKEINQNNQQNLTYAQDAQDAQGFSHINRRESNIYINKENAVHPVHGVQNIPNNNQSEVIP